MWSTYLQLNALPKGRVWGVKMRAELSLSSILVLDTRSQADALVTCESHITLLSPVKLVVDGASQSHAFPIEC